MFFLIKINLLYSLIIILLSIILNLHTYYWKPIISSNILLKLIFNILKLINSNIFIIFIFILSLFILFFFYKEKIFNIKNILIFSFCKFILDRFVIFFLKYKYKIPRPCILYINKKLNINLNQFIYLFKLNKIGIFYKSFNKILNIDSKINIINNYYSVISGHTLLLFSIYNIYFFIFYKYYKYNLLLIFSIINILLIYSRLILGMHFFKDILFSLILNLISLIIITIIFYLFNIKL